MLTRQQAIDLFGSVVILSEALGYKSRHAVYMWPKDRPIPEAAYLKIRYQLKPEAFHTDGTLIPSKLRPPVPTDEAA